jgi:hypothetical protein
MGTNLISDLQTPTLGAATLHALTVSSSLALRGYLTLSGPCQPARFGSTARMWRLRALVADQYCCSSTLACARSSGATRCRCWLPISAVCVWTRQERA